MRARTYGQLSAAILHVGMIAILSIAVVSPRYIQEEDVIPEPTRIEIGEQLVLPPALSEVEPEVEGTPPVGADVEVVDEPLDIPPVDDPSNIPPMDDDLPKPMDILDDSASKGLPGVPTPDVSEAERSSLRGPDQTGIPELLGVPLEGDTLFLVDLSGSMDEPYNDTTRYLAIIAELSNAINALRETDSFDVVAFSGAYTGGTLPLWGSLQLATPENKRAAVKWLGQRAPDNGTPTLEALRYACKSYPESLDNLILVTDGVPNVDTSDVILGSIERMISKFTDLDFVCISVSSDGLNFVKRLVDRVNGTYVLVE